MHPSVANYWNGKGEGQVSILILFYFICYFLVSSLLLMPPLNSYQCAISVQRKVVLNSFSHKSYQQMWVFISYAIYIGCFWTSFTFKCVTKELLKKTKKKKIRNKETMHAQKYGTCNTWTLISSRDFVKFYRKHVISLLRKDYLSFLFFFKSNKTPGFINILSGTQKLISYKCVLFS